LKEKKGRRDTGEREREKKKGREGEKERNGEI